MSKILGCVWTVEWGNSYKEPPNGKEVLIESFQPVGSEYWSKHPPEINEAYPGFGKGYCVTWRCVSSLPKILSQEKLKNVRRKRLERRMKNKYPLFAEEMIREEMEKKKNYYDGITDSDLQALRDDVYEKHEKYLESIKDKIQV